MNKFLAKSEHSLQKIHAWLSAEASCFEALTVGVVVGTATTMYVMRALAATQYASQVFLFVYGG